MTDQEMSHEGDKENSSSPPQNEQEIGRLPALLARLEQYKSLITVGGILSLVGIIFIFGMAAATIASRTGISDAMEIGPFSIPFPEVEVEATRIVEVEIIQTVEVEATRIVEVEIMQTEEVEVTRIVEILQPETVVESALDISLVGLRYGTGNWNHRLVDLGKAAGNRDGIPVIAGQQLRFEDVQIYSPEDRRDLDIQAEVYVGGTNEPIGNTKLEPLREGIINLGDVEYDPDNNQKFDYWEVQEQWETLLVALVAYADGQHTVLNRIWIRLDPDGTAWLLEPPNISLASLVYRVNDGPNQVLDLRHGSEYGIKINPKSKNDKDSLAIEEVWYYSNTDGDTLKVELLLYKDGEVVKDDTFHQTEQKIEKGFHAISGAKKRWKNIPDDRNMLVVKLLREDNIIVHELEILLDPDSEQDLIPYKEVFPFYSDSIDFEHQEEVAEWQGFETTSILQSTEQSYTGEGSLAITFAPIGDTKSEQFVEGTRKFSAEMIVGQVFWPALEDGGYVQCTAIPKSG